MNWKTTLAGGTAGVAMLGRVDWGKVSGGDIGEILQALIGLALIAGGWFSKDKDVKGAQ